MFQGLEKSMFALIKDKFTPDNMHDEAARAVYAACLEQVRRPVFYTDYRADDRFEGRFDLLLVHLFCVLHVVGDKDGAFNQALFDVCFADMEQTLREMGIGDMGIPKHMKRMMKAFNGRMTRYEEAYASGKGAMIEALRLNLYGTCENVKDSDIKKMKSYIESIFEDLKIDDILQGSIQFPQGETS